MTTAHATDRPMPAAALQPPRRTFQQYVDKGFLDDILPILPHDAPIDPQSPSFNGLVEKRGKVPGKKVSDLWVGYRGWTDYTAVPADVPRWQGWGAGIGLQGRRFPALDIDINESGLADEVHKLATNILGHAPCRFGNGPRRILVFGGTGFAKRRLAFCPASGPAVNAEDGSVPAAGGLDASEPHAVEFLAAGQQYVVEGIHPKTGQPYYWSNGQSPVEVGAANLVVISAEQLDEFYERLEAFLVARGYTIVSRNAGRAGGGPVDQESLRAPDFDAVRRAMASLPNEVDYDGWVKVGAALKASAGLEHEAEAYELFMDWSLLWPENTPEAVEAKWQSLSPPYKVGWDHLSRFATEFGDGTFSTAQEDFDVVMATPMPGQESKGPIVSDKVEAMFNRYCWVEGLQRFCDLTTGDLLNREQFNFRNSHIGDPASSKECAYAVLARDGRRRQTVKSVTYRPGAGLFVEENLPGLVGRCVNLWRDPATHLPETATDADVEEWLDHMAFVIPDERERGIVINWLAWIIQNPGEKPNWAVLVGSTYEGMGKDMMLEPVRVALGAANVREIGPGDLTSSWTWWADRTRFVIVEEMHSFERKETMNRIKPLITAPPYTLTINKKMEPQYQVPNLLAAMFFTNMDNALAVSKQDRRFFITWNDGQPRPPSYYAALSSWYEAGGKDLAARWLQLRDVSAFEPKGRAPDTVAKGAMATAARPVLEELIEDDLNEGEGVLERQLFTLDEVVQHARFRLDDRRLGTQRVAAVLRKHGGVAVGRVMLGETPKGCSDPIGHQRRESTVYARRGHDLEGAPPAVIKEAYWAERRHTSSDLAPFQWVAAT